MSTPLPDGFRAAGLASGIKSGGALDLGLVALDEATPAAALFTKNQLLGAHVTLSREHLSRSGGKLRALLVNSGNANCATGAAGLEDARTVAAQLAGLLECPTEEVLFMSTGVIGERLPRARIQAALPDLLGLADVRQDGGLDAFARAVMTTDTHPKTSARDTDGLRVAGVAKGSGMIHPDMATMLGFLFADARPDDLRASLERIADASFHRTTVDGDTSPNDTLLAWASSAEVAPTVEPAWTAVARDLARSVAADGEGATRLVTIRVLRAPTEAAAVQVGRAVAISPLCKTAIAGQDPNWGRFLSAAAVAGVLFDPGKARVGVGDACVYECGVPRPDAEPRAHAHLASGAEVVVTLDLDAGQADADCWTCDLTTDYVHINADYRT